MTTKITYTFPATAPAALAGKTFSDGAFCRLPISGKVVDAVDFGPQSSLAGQHLICIIAGKPELEVAFAAHRADEAAKIEKTLAERKAYEQTLEGQREVLATAEYDSYSEDNYPGSRAWMANKRAADALAAFDAAHPEIIAAITAARKAKQAADYEALSDFIKMGS
jgi:hypothetical protein